MRAEAHRLRRALSAAVLLSALLAAAAFAAPGDLVTARDGDDTPVNLDISTATLRQTVSGTYEARVTMHEEWRASDLLATAGPPGSICVKFWTVTTPGSTPPDHMVCATARPGGTGLRAGVFRERPGTTPIRVGTATTSVQGQTLLLRLPARLIGTPRTVQFAAEATQAAGCPRPQGCRDRAPNGGRTVAYAPRSAAASNGR